MPTVEEERWASAQQALSRLDAIRPNPKGIRSETIKLKHGYRQPYSEYYEAETAEGRKYCFVDWAQEGEVISYYYGYRNGNGLVFQAKLQEKLKERGFTSKLIQLEQDHDNREGKPPLTEDVFLAFMTKNDVLVPGPLPAPIESIVKGVGIALWMPEGLYQLTSYFGWVDRQRQDK